MTGATEARLLALAPDGLEHVVLVEDEQAALTFAVDLAGRAQRGRPRVERVPLVVEPGVGTVTGALLPPVELAALRARCDAEAVLLVADERVVGLGRTGALFACDHALVTPDVLVLAGAVLWTERVQRGAGREGPVPLPRPVGPQRREAVDETVQQLLEPAWRTAVPRIAAELAAGLQRLPRETWDVLGALAVVRHAAAPPLLLLPALDATSQQVARLCAEARAALRAA